MRTARFQRKLTLRTIEQLVETTQGTDLLKRIIYHEGQANPLGTTHGLRAKRKAQLRSQPTEQRLSAKRLHCSLLAQGHFMEHLNAVSPPLPWAVTFQVASRGKGLGRLASSFFSLTPDYAKLESPVTVQQLTAWSHRTEVCLRRTFTLPLAPLTIKSASVAAGAATCIPAFWNRSADQVRARYLHASQKQ